MSEELNDLIKQNERLIYSLMKDYNNYIDKEDLSDNIYYGNRVALLKLNKLLDSFNKYNIETEELKALNKKVENRKFSNKNTVVKEGKLKEILEKGINLSYTSISEYFKCPYLFYLNRILKIKKDANLDSLFIGNLCHDVLYKLFIEDKDWQLEDIRLFVTNFYNESKVIINKKNSLFIDIYSEYLYSVYSFIKKTMNRSLLKITSLEETYSTNLKIDGYVLTGKIDKVLSLEAKNKEYVVVLDYKTGSGNINLNNIVHGYDMQILFYDYFLKKLKDIEFAGGYLQPVLPSNVITSEKDKNYNELLEDYYRYNGYRNRDLTIISSIDRDYDNKSFIKGINILKDGSLSSNAEKKTITDDQFSKLLDIVSNKIDEACSRIYNGDFGIQPTSLDELSCSRCVYKDICYYQEEDIKYLQKYNDFSFLKKKV